MKSPNVCSAGDVKRWANTKGDPRGGLPEMKAGVLAIIADNERADARVDAAHDVSRIYFEIATDAVGEDGVRRLHSNLVDQECKTIQRIRAERDALIDACAVKDEALRVADMLTAKVNGVTCPHRHGNKIHKDKLDRLSNFQIEAEKAITDGLAAGPDVVVVDKEDKTP